MSRIKQTGPKLAEQKDVLHLQLLKRIQELQNQLVKERTQHVQAIKQLRIKRQNSQQNASVSLAQISDLKKSLQQRSQKDRLEVQNSRKIEDLFKSQLNSLKTQIESEINQKYAKRIQEKDRQIGQLQEELKKQKAKEKDFNKIAVDVNELAITKRTLENVKKQYENLTEKYAKALKTQTDEISDLKNQNQRALAQLSEISKKQKQQFQKLKRQQASKYSQRNKILEKTSFLYLQLLAQLQTVQKEITPKQNTLFKTYLGCIKNLKETTVPTPQKQTQLRVNFQKIIAQILAAISGLKSQKASLQKGIRDQQTQNGQQSKRNKENQRKLQDFIKELQSKLKGKDNQLQSKARQIEGLKNKHKQQLDLKVKEIQQMGKKNNSLQEKLRLLEDGLRKKEQKISQLNIKITDLETINKRINDENSQLKLRISDLQKQVGQLKANIADLEKNIKELLKRIADLQTKNGLLIREIQQHKRKHQENAVKIRQLTKKLEDLTKKYQDLKKQHEDLRKKLQQQTRKTQELLARYNDLVKKNDELKKQHDKIKKAHDKLKNENQEIITQLQLSRSTQRQLRVYQQVYHYINDRFVNELAYYIAKAKVSFHLDNYQQSVDKALNTFKALFNQAKFFAGSDALIKQQISFVIQSVNKFTGKTVEQSKLLYRYDPKSNVNFHSYIDSKENIVVLAKLANGYVVGGYSRLPVQRMEKMKAQQIGLGQGILFSVTNKTVFRMKKDPRMPVVSYDDFFFIFGNSEIRLKTQERKIFSNFGVAASTFDSMGEPKLVFMGQNISECDVHTYEFYQLNFRPS